ncbi:molybdopterin-guanine dinucleotide biosynthesis protein B [[Eubacterium] cellulosolvens]
MKEAKLLAVVGTKNSGKSTVAECVISGLTMKGLRVGSIKHIHHPDFTIDTEGTDTWRHARAGSRVVAAVSNKEIAVILKHDPEQTLDSVLEFMATVGLDIIVVEGLHSSIGRRPEVFKIVTAHDVEDLRDRLRDIVPPILAISGVIAQSASRLTDVDAPIIDSKADCSKLVELVEQKLIRRRNDAKPAKLGHVVLGDELGCRASN